MNALPNESSSLACHLMAILSEAREEHGTTAATFIENEWLCCPFFHVGLKVEPSGGLLWLRLAGGEGVKEILQTTLFESILGKVVPKQLIQTGATAIIMRHYPNH